jgi:hypothetical protein
MMAGGQIFQEDDALHFKPLGIDEPDSGIRAFSRLPITKPIKVRIDFTRLTIPAVTTTNGAFHLLGFVMPVNPGDEITSWAENTPTGDDTLAAMVRGYRFTFANTNTEGTAQSDRVRMQFYEGNGDKTRIEPVTEVGTVNLGLNVLHTLEFEWRGDTAIFRAIELAKTQTFRSPLLSGFDKGHLMFYSSPGTETRWGNFRTLT